MVVYWHKGPTNVSKRKMIVYGHTHTYIYTHMHTHICMCMSNDPHPFYLFLGNSLLAFLFIFIFEKKQNFVHKFICYQDHFHKNLEHSETCKSFKVHFLSRWRKKSTTRIILRFW